MRKIVMFFFLLTLCASLAGIVFLLTWDIPAPSAEVSRIIPNAELLN